MNLLDAAYDTVHSYPGGSEALAPRLGKAAGVIRREVKGDPANKLGLMDASRIIGLTGDKRIIHALCAEHGMVAIPVDGEGDATDILGLFLEKQQAGGELAAETRAALADGVVTLNELSRVRQALARKQAVLDRMYQHLVGMHATSAPGAVDG